MNRVEEYQDIVQELNQTVPELEHIYERAEKRYRHRNRYIRTLGSALTVVFLFVLLVNVSVPVAQA